MSSPRQQLMVKARRVARRAYAPYSNFRVGVAIQGSKGVYLGVNVENACTNLGICGERSALSAARAAGESRIICVAISCPDADPALGPNACMPCGACRQWLCELAPEAEIYIDGIREVFTPEILLPKAFVLPRG